MQGNIVVGWDGSAEAVDALALANALRPPDGIVTRVSVAEPAARALAAAAIEHGADLLVVGSSHDAVDGRVHVGSVGRALTDEAVCPIAVAPRSYRKCAHSPSDVTVVFDASGQVPGCVGEGSQLAASLDARLHLACVMPPLEQWARETGEESELGLNVVSRHFQAEFERLLCDAARAAGVPGERLRLLDGRPMELLVEEAGTGADLLVTSAPPCGALHRILFGGQARALQAALVPVVIVPCVQAERRRGSGRVRRRHFAALGHQ